MFRFLLLVSFLLVGQLAAQEGRRWQVPPVLASSGGVYLAVEPGKLEVEISKQDLNLADKYQNNLYVWLLTPDRQVAAKGHLVDSGAPGGSGPGTLESLRLEVDVATPGVYLLFVQLTGFDGKRNDIVWGFSTNAAQYMIGRVDLAKTKGRTPISLLNLGGEPLELFFRPTLEKTRVQLRTLSEESGHVTFHRPGGKKPLELEVGPKWSKGTSFTTQPEGEELWSVALGSLSVELEIAGVTSWKSWGGYGYEDHAFWSFHREAFFPIATHRWSLLPYTRVRVLAEGERKGEVAVELYNHSRIHDRRFQLSVEPPAEAALSLTNASEEVVLGPGEKRVVPLSFRLSAPLAREEAHRIRIRDVTTSAWTTYSTLRFLPPGTGEGALALPLVYEPFKHLAEQIGEPLSIPPNQVDFDPQNRPFIRQTLSRHETEGLSQREGGAWRLRSFISAVREAIPGFVRTDRGSAFFSTRTAFDAEGGVYTTLTAIGPEGGSRYLLYQPRAEAPFQVYPVDAPGRAVVDLEGFTGHNRESVAPPPLVHYAYREGGKENADEPFKVAAALTLVLPEKQADGTLSLEKRWEVSNHAISLCTHSGGASTLLSAGGWVYLLYGEVVDASTSSAAGVPTYIVAWHRQTGERRGPVLVGHAPPVNDMHNSSGLTMDARGTLHVLLGAHGKKPFQHTHSLRPGSIVDGWSPPQVVCTTGLRLPGKQHRESGAQTYVGFVCGPDGTLYTAFRHDFQNPQGLFPDFDERYRALSFQRKRPGQPWEPPQPIVLPPLPGYSVYYHKLTIDRKGVLYLYYTYRSGNSIYRSERPGDEASAVLLLSRDGGESWHAARDADFD